jgi:hypothetical protein
MVTFTNDEKTIHRREFINECRQKAWGAACHAAWISGQLDKLVSDYGKLKADDEKLAGEIKALETALDGHTKDNRDKRKAVQERGNALFKANGFPRADHPGRADQGQQPLRQHRNQPSARQARRDVGMERS